MRALLILLFFGSLGFAQEVRRALPVSNGTPVWNARAKYLAGVPLLPSDPLARMQQDSTYRAHAATFENMWARYNERYFSPIRLWAAAELAPRIPVAAPVFYFFGGPDAISCLAFFPEAADFLIGGLEPVGTVPSPESLPPDRLYAALANLRTSTEVILSFGHFITKDMKAELEASEFKGVTPVMLVFLAMSGCEVLDVSYFGIRGDGSVAEWGGEPGGNGLPGVRITFRKNALSAPQRIHYVQANIADDSVQTNGGVLKWAGGFGRGNVYLKAASYLLHEPYFSKIRNFLLDQAASILQDDSGIPFSFLRDGQWRFWFFGNYTGTLDIFKKYHQPELVAAFGSSGVPIVFGTGYKWRVGESNLLLAVRQAPPRAEPVTSPPR
ncbi:MAG: hypothetical protein ACOYM3_03980 [Terrimicrobiaceae bacterium]